MYVIFSLNNSLFKDYVSPIVLLEFDLTETNKAASFAWHIELCHDTIDEDNKANIQLKIYTLQKRKPLVQYPPVSFDI
jgi:hypothetical protein